MAPGAQMPPAVKPTKVAIETKKLIPAIVFMYQSENKGMINMSLELAACIMESYTNAKEMKKDILETFVGRKSMYVAMQRDVERKFPVEARSLKNIFGESLFGG